MDYFRITNSAITSAIRPDVREWRVPYVKPAERIGHQIPPPNLPASERMLILEYWRGAGWFCVSWPPEIGDAEAARKYLDEYYMGRL